MTRTEQTPTIAVADGEAIWSRPSTGRAVGAPRLSLPLRRSKRPLAFGGYAVLAFLLAFPLIWMFATSFKSTSEFIRDAYPLGWKSFLPAHATIANFTQLFDVYGFGRNLLNTVIVSVGQVGGSLILCPLAGYAFAKLYIPFRRVLFVFCLLPAFVPVEVVVVPLYSVVKSLGLLSTYPAVVPSIRSKPIRDLSDETELPGDTP